MYIHMPTSTTRYSKLDVRLEESISYPVNTSIDQFGRHSRVFQFLTNSAKVVCGLSGEVLEASPRVLNLAHAAPAAPAISQNPVSICAGSAWPF
jgi:hypothetical protein